MTPRIYNYLNARGIRANFNTLGHTPALANSYIAGTETLMSLAGVNRSNDIKNICYNKFYKIEDRPCINGFEEFEKIDSLFRMKSNKNINTNRPANSYETIPDRSLSSFRPFNVVLKESFAEYNAPILMYLSGGTDSEFVACALLDANIKFTPVIFNWTDRSGTIKNSKDTDYAYKFCKDHGLAPIVETVDIETLWNSVEFLSFGAELQLVSPQLTTHVYMVMRMNESLPGRYHLHGGEVRYRPRFAKNSLGEETTLVYSTKTSLDFAAHYVNQATLTDVYSAAQRYSVNTTIRVPDFGGPWQVIQAYDFGPYTGDPSGTSGSPTSGTYAVAPYCPTGYDQTYTLDATYSFTGNNSDIYTSYYPGWAPCNTGTPIWLMVCASVGQGSGNTWQTDASYTYSIRSADLSGVISSVVRFTCTLVM